MSGKATAPAGLIKRRAALCSRRVASPRGITPSGLPWLLTLGIAAVYIVVFLVQLPHTIGEPGWNSDFASGFVVPETIVKSGTGGHTVLGTYGSYLPLWLGLLTANLPLHRQLWEIAPTLVLLATALTIGWSVAQVACRRAAVLATLIVLVASPWALGFFMAAVAHNVVWPATALLGAYFVWLARGRRRRLITTIAVPLSAAVVLGVCVASDALLIATGVIPAAITAIAVGVLGGRYGRRVAVSVLATIAVAFPVAKLISAIMSSQGYLTFPNEVEELAPLSTLSKHTQVLFDGLKRLFNGYLGHEPVDGVPTSGPLHSELGLACDVVLVAALITLLAVGASTSISFLLSRRRGEDPHGQASLARTTHVVYWVSSAIVICAAFERNMRAEVGHESYYATVIFSVAAVVPLLMRRGSPAQWLIPAGASIFFAGSLVGLTGRYQDGIYNTPISHTGSEIVRLAENVGVTAGYAGYWDASSLTWSTNERVTVRPLVECGNPAGADICPFYLETVPSWYVPRNIATFLIVDTTQPFLSRLPEGLGPPIASYTVGPMQMYVYPYDIAARLGAPEDYWK